VIRVTKDGRTIRTGKHYTEFRHAIYDRCEGICEGCNRGLVFWEMEVHHKNGRGMGGGKRDDIPKEVLGLCGACHGAEHA
jgi:hypothetical protein